MAHHWSPGILAAMVAMLWQPVLAGDSGDLRDIATLLPRDAIPAILDPKPLLVPGRTGEGISDETRVPGFALGGEAHAYPIAFLSWHEIVNDVVGGRPADVRRVGQALPERAGDVRPPDREPLEPRHG